MSPPVDPTGRREDGQSEEARARSYYDTFAETYEARRDGRGRYHDLLDAREIDLATPYVRGRAVLEVGCGTGLVLRSLAAVAARAVGVDLSPGMLARARDRGLEVHEGSATALPFPDRSFDVAVSFKTLPHVPDLKRALSEMARVVRPGGVLIAEVYNPASARHLVKRLLPPGRIGRGARLTERDVACRYDDAASFAAALPAGCRIERARGIRILVPAAAALEVPIVSELLVRSEELLGDTAIGARLGGFVCWVVRVGDHGA
jgi:ubiquinone/menaquinone biosynthesis C-methylase UbiE